MPSEKLLMHRGDSGYDYAPKGYRRLKYAKTNGLARLYVNVPISTNNVKTVIYGKCTGYGSDTSYYRAVAAYATGYANLRVGFIKNYTNSFGLESAYTYPQGSRMLQPFKLILNWKTTGLSFTIDGVTHDGTRNAVPGTSGISVPSNTNATEKQTGVPMELTRIDVFVGSELVRRYIPMSRESDDVTGFYETVNGEFKESSSTTPFTAGPEI